MKFEVILEVPDKLLTVAPHKEVAFLALLSGFLVRTGIRVLAVEKIKKEAEE